MKAKISKLVKEILSSKEGAEKLRNASLSREPTIKIEVNGKTYIVHKNPLPKKNKWTELYHKIKTWALQINRKS